MHGVLHADLSIHRNDAGQGKGSPLHSFDGIVGFLVSMDEPGNLFVSFCCLSPHELKLENARHEGRALVIVLSLGAIRDAQSFVGHPFEQCRRFPFTRSLLFRDLGCSGRVSGQGIVEFSLSRGKQFLNQCVELRDVHPGVRPTAFYHDIEHVLVNL